jgi:hypothetical protein
MSRAFVKEDENDLAELPDRSISPHRNFGTEAGLRRLRPLSAVRGGAPRRNRQRRQGSRRRCFAGSPLLESAARKRGSRQPPPADKSTASVGMTVSLRRADGREQSFRIVGEDEADPSRGHALLHVATRAGRSDARARRDGGNDRRRCRHTGRSGRRAC